MELKRNFLNTVMDKDSDDRTIQPGRMRDAVNVRVGNSEGSDVGALENCLGNEALSSLDFGPNPEVIGADKSMLNDTIYWLVVSDDRGCFVGYNTKDNNPAFKILEDTRVGNLNVLNLDRGNHVDRIIIIEDTDNNATYACWTDDRNEVRFVNIERALTYGLNGFDEDDITLMKKAPSSMPVLTLENTTSGEENTFLDRFLRVGYRYEYLDGQYSAPSPFSEIAFFPKSFDYDYSTNSNESMVNNFNQIDVALNTGGKTVRSIQLLFKESGDNTFYVYDDYKKSTLTWADNTVQNVKFKNIKSKRVLPKDEINRLFDTVPKRAKTAEYLGNRIALGDYTENYNLIDPQDNPIDIDLSLSFADIPGTDAPTKNIKSIRSYEVGVSYVDRFGRMTTVLNSLNNDVFVPGSKANDKKTFQVTIGNLAPKDTIGYRFFIKQSKNDYESIIPTLFYEDGIFIWMKLDSGEQDKIKEGDYLVVKSGSNGLLDEYIETRVIEIVDQPKNFLETDDTITDVKQLSGNYFKIKPDGFRISEADFEDYQWKSYDDSGAINPIMNEANVIYDPIYYGVDGINDLTKSGTYTNNTEDLRYLIEMDDVTGASDTFKWSIDNGTTFTSGIVITGAAQLLSNGLSITFANTTGHTQTDKWIISAKGNDTNDFGDQENSKAYVVLKSVPGDTIEGGARITMIYNEFNEHTAYIEKQFISSTRYANLEEWYYGDNISTEFGDVFNAYWFRRGSVTFLDTRNVFTQESSGDMCMIIRSIGTQNSGIDNRAKLEGKLNIFQSDNNIILETKATEVNDDIYFEIGQTYPISVEGYHLGVDGADVSQTNTIDAVINLPFFNCFTWNNGIESYKVKDAFNAKTMGIDTRALSTIQDYRENRRISGIIYGGVFNQTNQYNALNEFNASLVNYIDLDDAYGAIQKMYSRDTDLFVVQEHRLQPLGYYKTEVFDKNGNPNLVRSNEVLSILRSYTGEYGMTPDSFAVFGNRIYGADPNRGTPLRLSIDGVTEISMAGMTDYFKDIFRTAPDARYEAGYDPYFDEYILSITETVGASTIQQTIGFSEKSNGWVSKYSFVPEKMVGLNNQFYSFKNGQLYIHNSENVPRNNFYGVQYESSVTVVFNDSPSDDKIFKAIKLEGDTPWLVELKTDLGSSSILKEAFELRESNYHAYTRRNEDENDASSFSTIGLGNSSNSTGNSVQVPQQSCYVHTGDKIYQVVSGANVFVGEVLNIQGAIISISPITNIPVDNVFTYIKKPATIEGAVMRGYYMEAKLTSDATGAVELFSINSNTVKSHV